MQQGVIFGDTVGALKAVPQDYGDFLRKSCGRWYLAIQSGNPEVKQESGQEILNGVF